MLINASRQLRNDSRAGNVCTKLKRPRPIVDIIDLQSGGGCSVESQWTGGWWVVKSGTFPSLDGGEWEGGHGRKR